MIKLFLLMHQLINVYQLMKNIRIGILKIKRITLTLFVFNSRSPYGREYELLCELSPGNLATYKAPILWKFQTQPSY